MSQNGGTLMDFGLAVNFLGNYRSESVALDNMVGRLNGSLVALQGLIVGGGITAGIYRFTNSMVTMAKTMEQNFANLTSVLGSTRKAIEALEWARKKGASTPFEIPEVNNALSTMTTMGFNKNDQMREKVFNSVGDFAALKGWDFGDMMQRVAKATFGNWESLGDQFGVRKQTIGTMAKEQMARTPEKFAGQESQIQKAIQIVEKGKQGTEEFKMAVVELIGVLGNGGMLKRLDTIAGAWSNVNDLASNFMMKLVGYSQEAGTFANAVKNTIVNKVLKPFMDSHTVVINGITQTTTSVDQLGRIGEGVGQIFTSLWSAIDEQIGNSANTIRTWIDRLDAFFADYKNNVAPIVLFLYLVKMQVEDFLSGFYNGFKNTFTWFIEAGLGVWKVIGDIAVALGLAETPADALGKVLGSILGIMLGISVFRFIVSPFTSLIGSVQTFYDGLVKARALILVSEGWSLKDSILFRWMQFKDGIVRMASALRLQALWTGIVSGATAVWNAVLAVNPIVWVITAIVGLIAVIVVAWNKFEGFRKAIFVLWETFKQVFTNIGTFFGKIFSPIGDAIQAFKDNDWAKMGLAVGQLALNVATAPLQFAKFVFDGGMTTGMAEVVEKGKMRSDNYTKVNYPDQVSSNTNNNTTNDNSKKVHIHNEKVIVQGVKGGGQEYANQLETMGI